MSSSASGIRDGTPSTTTPIAGPWLSPQVVKRKRVPKEFPPTAPSSDRADVGCVDRLHADPVIPAVDVMHLAGDAAGEIAQKVEAGAADLLDGDVALERRVVLVPFEDIAEVA